MRLHRQHNTFNTYTQHSLSHRHKRSEQASKSVSQPAFTVTPNKAPIGLARRQVDIGTVARC